MVKDKIENLNEQLKNVKTAFDELKKSGINKEILEIFLHHKTKILIKKVKLLLKNTEEFFNDLIAKETLEKI